MHIHLRVYAYIFIHLYIYMHVSFEICSLGVGLTNRPELLHEALLRPGRLEVPRNLTYVYVSEYIICIYVYIYVDR